MLTDDIAGINFTEVMKRIYRATNTSAQIELAKILGIRQAFLTDAKRRNTVPALWLKIMLRKNGINPAWILSGAGEIFIQKPAGEPPGSYPV